MENELQIPVMNDTVLKEIYCIIELVVSYTNRLVYICCPKCEDYERVVSKIQKDYKDDNYILAACEHKYEFSYKCDGTGYINTTQIILTL